MNSPTELLLMNSQAVIGPEPDLLLTREVGFIAPLQRRTAETTHGITLEHITVHCHWMGRPIHDAAAAKTAAVNSFKFSGRQFGPAFSLN